MDSKPTLPLIPCFTGAPWQLHQFRHLRGWSTRTMQPPRRMEDIESLGDFVLDKARDLDRYVLLGGIMGSREVILPRTGQMFRFSHPGRYSEAVNQFLGLTVTTLGDAR